MENCGCTFIHSRFLISQIAETRSVSRLYMMHVLKEPVAWENYTHGQRWAIERYVDMCCTAVSLFCPKWVMVYSFSYISSVFRIWIRIRILPLSAAPCGLPPLVTTAHFSQKLIPPLKNSVKNTKNTLSYSSCPGLPRNPSEDCVKAKRRQRYVDKIIICVVNNRWRWAVSGSI